jgi:hypothetical protein
MIRIFGEIGALAPADRLVGPAAQDVRVHEPAVLVRTADQRLARAPEGAGASHEGSRQATRAGPSQRRGYQARQTRHHSSAGKHYPSCNA